VSLVEKLHDPLLFDFGVTPRVVSTQPTMTVSNRFQRSRSVHNNWQQLRYDGGW